MDLASREITNLLLLLILIVLIIPVVRAR